MSLSQVAQEHGLHRVGARPPLLQYLGEVWRRRAFITTMARYRLRSTFEQNRLGIVWVVLRPLINAIIYGFIFGVIQGASRPDGFAQYVVVGVFFFGFFTGCLNDGAKSITSNRNLVQSLAFPRITLPLAIVVENLMSFLATLVVLVPILAFFGHYPKLEWLYMVPLIALFTLFNTGVALIAARLTVHVTDLTQLLPFISRLLFYSSGVLFAVDKILANHPLAMKAFDYHPLYQVLRIARHHLIGASSYPMQYWWMLAGVSVVTLIAGVLFFWVAEERYGRE